MGSDNVIDARSAFGLPVDPTPAASAGGGGMSGADMQELIGRAIAAGVDPRELLSQVFAQGVAGMQPDPFALPAPTLKSRRAESATYRIRLELNDVHPPIWRQLDLPSDLTLDTVHTIVQVAMGWTGMHLHQFWLEGADGGRCAPLLTPEAESEGEEGIPEADVRLDEVMAKPGDTLYYDYDFGDGWEHSLVLEDVLPLGPAGCVAGQRACPPEDCGGIPGYEDIMAVVTGKPKGRVDAETARHLRDWLPPDWSSEEFDVAETDDYVRTVAEGGIPGMPDLDVLDPRLLDLMERCAGTVSEGYLATLLVPALADLPGGMLSDQVPAGEGEEDAWPDPAVVAAVTTPLLVLLDVIGDGVDLTSAGYLKPAVVEAIFTRLDMGREWPGAGNREDQTPPVADLRRAAQHLGLIRRRGSQLAPTNAAIALHADQDAMWRHITTRLPVGPARNHDPALILLLMTAGGASPSMSGNLYHQVLDDTGWRDGQFTHNQIDAAITPTWEVISALGGVSGRDDITDIGMDLATSALLRG